MERFSNLLRGTASVVALKVEIPQTTGTFRDAGGMWKSHKD